MSKLLRNKKGAGGVIYALITMMVMLLVSIIIINSLIGAITPDDTWTEEANNTWDTTQTNIWLALGLVVIGIIIMGSVAILSMLRGSGR